MKIDRTTSFLPEYDEEELQNKEILFNTNLRRSDYFNYHNIDKKCYENINDYFG